jgi:hypothetical protein
MEPNKEKTAEEIQAEKDAKKIEISIKKLASADSDFINVLYSIALVAEKNQSLYKTAKGLLNKEAAKLLKK